MKHITITTAILLTTITFAQQIYELTPGVKGNQIVLQLSNISESLSAENVEVKLIRQSANLKFNTTEARIHNLKKKEENEVAFSFDVSYNAELTKQDTVEFLITCGNATDNQTIRITKQFIFTYSQPKEFRLEQNYPNPFNPNTRIWYAISSRQYATIKVYDILGNEAATLVNEEKPAGYYEVEWDASRVASGVYIYRLSTGSFNATKKLIVLK